MSRLSERKKTREQVEQSLIGKQDEDLRINIVVRTSLIEWLDRAIAEYNRSHPRTTNRSEVIRTLLDRLREEGLEGLLK